MATAENANNLGAPAQGFGQDVTFAVKPGGVPNQQDLSRAVPVQGGVEGAGMRAATDHTIVAAKPPEDNSFAMLMAAGNEILGPKVKEARTAAFVKGMQRAAQGEAVKDIVDQQPWYARIFGDSDAVAGARAYAGHAQAAAAAGAIEDQMPTLRAMSPDAAQDVFKAAINGSLTGDATTDAQIMGTLTQQMPALMRRHAKEHYAWQQDQASQAEGHAMMQGADALQKAAAGTVFEGPDGQLLPGSVRPEEFAAQAEAWVRSIRPAAGRDATNWQISTSKTLAAMANKGNFHALAAFDKAGGFEALTEKQASDVRTRWESEEKSQRALNEAPYMKQIADIRASMKYPTDGRTVNDYIKQMQDVNSAYTARSGSRLGIFTPEQMTSLVTEGIETLRKDRIADWKASQAEAAKANTIAQKDAARVRGVNQLVGQLKLGYDIPDASASDRREAWNQLQGQGPDAYFPAAIKTFQTSGHLIDTTLSGSMKGAALTAEASKDPTALLQMYTDKWLPLQSGYTKDKNGQFTGDSGSTVADAYMGDDLGKKMRVFHDIMRQGPQFAAAAFNTAFVLPLKTVHVGDVEKADKQLRKDVASGTSHTFPEWWGTSEEHGNIDLRPDQVGMVSGMVRKTVRDEMIDEGDHAKSTNIALSRLKRQGLATLGGYAWINPEGTKPFAQSVDKDVPVNRVAESFRDTITAKVKAAGLDDDHIQLIRDRDSATGTAQFVAIVSSGGEQHVLAFTGDDVSATYKSKREKKAALKAAVGTPLVAPGSSTAERISHRPNLVGADPRAYAPTE